MFVQLRDYLLEATNDELTERLKYVDKAIHELHEHGYFVVGYLADIMVNDGEITLESFKDKIDYLKSGYDINGDRQDIFELCIIGICAYNKSAVLKTDNYMEKTYIQFVMDSLEMLFLHGNVPSMMQEYYIDVFDRGNVTYLNVFIVSHYGNNPELDNQNGSGRDNSRGAYNKSTPVGRALSEKDAAFASIMLIPALLALVYISAVVIYFLFIK